MAKGMLMAYSCGNGRHMLHLISNDQVKSDTAKLELKKRFKFNWKFVKGKRTNEVKRQTIM